MSFTPFFILFYSFLCRTLTKSTLFPYTTLFRSGTDVRATLREANDVFDLTDAEVRPDLVCDGPEVFRREKDRKSTRLNSSHLGISYAVFCLKKKKRGEDKARDEDGLYYSSAD